MSLKQQRNFLVYTSLSSLLRIFHQSKAISSQDKARGALKVLNHNGYGLVVMTLASHARGRGFDPLFPYAFCLSVRSCSKQLALARVVLPGGFRACWHPGGRLVLCVVLLLVGHHEGESLRTGLPEPLGRTCIACIFKPTILIVLL